MLQLKQITKDYPVGDGKVSALRGVDLTFRKSEFVSILGPSGCGKTTMLNIIGGLDGYTSGDLVINGRSTKDFKARDWDAYRNHSVGFVFQSYNLIPHQSVLQNVELALSLSGVGKAERRQRAKAALERVGLGDQLKKRPGEMSGGQMQRVAIARAIVNDPDIILADEPTGALDSETSVQVMEILKEIAKDRLVVMVTHNPELAEAYSTRIVRMLDGLVTDDSAPVTEEEMAKEELRYVEESKKEPTKKPSLSFATSFGLSLKNLFTKKGRTALTSFAGSIGIIGIALIYAVSNGMTNYINTVQEDTLSSYPIVLESTHVDLGSLMTTMMDMAESKQEHPLDGVYQKPVMYDLTNLLNSIETQENDLKAFKAFLDSERANENSELGLPDSLSGVHYGYNINVPIYTKSVDGTVIHSDSQEMLTKIFMKYMRQLMGSMAGSENVMSSGGGMMSMMSGSNNAGGLWQEMLPGDGDELINPLLKKQYDLVEGGRWPSAYNEVVLVLDENNELPDIALYALGLISEAEIDKIVDAAINKKPLDVSTKRWSYEEIYAMEFRTVFPADCYVNVGGKWVDMRETDEGRNMLYSKATPLKVVGVIRPNPDSVAGMLTGSIAYTSALTEHIITESKDSAVIKAQLESPTVDIFTGLPFNESKGSLTDAEKKALFLKYVSALSVAEKAKLYVAVESIPNDEILESTVDVMLSQLGEDPKAAMAGMLAEQTGMDMKTVTEYLAAMSDEEFRAILKEQAKKMYAEKIEASCKDIPAEALAAKLDEKLASCTDKDFATYYDQAMEFAPTTYKANLRQLGCVELDNPATISLYAATFADKDVIEAAIEKYNGGVDEAHKISYTDYVGLMMSSVTTIIDAITYVLIGFVSVSLIVSSIMIGVITLISVQERTKEIGILRAIGASKKNVSRMFNAETVIIGFISGLVGVGVTYLLCLPLNAILNYLTGIANLRAQLPIGVAAILVLISVILTLISGIIPSRSAAKKDPVVALRTE
jgi:putative ABC transport system permease protein